MKNKNQRNSWILIGLFIFCFQHALRDFLQILGFKFFFTEAFHTWNAPQYEKLSLAVSLAFCSVILVALKLNSRPASIPYSLDKSNTSARPS